MSRYFFRVLIGEWKTKLRIPRLFVFSFSLTPRTVILINGSSKNLWKVDMEQVEKDPTELYFRKGWSRFVRENDLMAADFLIFKFDGNSTFKVVICGKSACEKMLESQARTQTNQKKNVGENRKAKDPILVEIKEEKLDLVDSGNSSEETWDETWDEKEEDEEEDEQQEYGDINSGPRDTIMNTGEGSSLAIIPSFKIKLQLASAKRGVMCIPTDFFKKYMRRKKHEVEMETVKGVWKVTSLPHLKRGQMFARFSRGWSGFARRNRFQAGETLLFRMIQRGDRPKFIVSKE
ncbi:hypothetical protein QN277_024822 [Acacia crassicarpa]|uniref:TF-B3 domain-containing protein n=1 Tax=Acacia crassicarpa TaxID=499986 RepID=A0AAE1JGV4_9FABA|nr:hypothetical protein QN277_024822 [Acacia crassicarpa]